MFRRLGMLAVRYPVQILVAWVVVMVAIIATAPKLSDVVSSSQASYLPSDVNSQQAQTILHRAFPKTYAQASSVVVLTGPAGPRQAYEAQLSTFITHVLRPAPASVVSDSLTPALRASLDSQDGAATLIEMGWQQADSSTGPADSVKHLRTYIAAHPAAGVAAKVTGDVAINNDYQDQVNNSTTITTIATVLLVVAILLAVFRSVTLLIVPLVTIAISLEISSGIVAFFATHGLTVSSNTPIFMIVLLAGAGTDYCLFLASRFREELSAGKDVETAVVDTMTHVGEAIASSGLAVIVGTGSMAFARFGLFNTAGPAVATGVAITLLAALTITPALLRLLGARTFWPARVEHVRPSRFWQNLGRLVTQRPVMALVLLLVLLVPLNAAVLKTSQQFDFLGDLSNTVEAHSGFNTLEAHYGAGNALPATLVLQADHSLRTATSLAQLDRLDAQIVGLPGISGVQGPTRPAGTAIPYQTFTRNPLIAAALARNLSANGTVAQYTVTTSLYPYSKGALDLIKQIRGIAQVQFPTARVQTTGASATITDIQNVTSSDLIRIGLFVLGGIFIVLVLLLRALVAPIYLLLTVLLSLGATVGTTTIVFQGFGGQSGLVFWVPFLILTLVIGLSTDYNILLISRVREEAARGGDYRAAVARAVERTGAIINTCGLVLAGSFGTLMLASVTGLRELGFAVAFGVLLDTFLLRTILVPALVVLVGQFSWFPRRLVPTMPARPTYEPA